MTYDDWKLQSNDKPQNTCLGCGELTEDTFCDDWCRKTYIIEI